MVDNKKPVHDYFNPITGKDLDRAFKSGSNDPEDRVNKISEALKKAGLTTIAEI